MEKTYTTKQVATYLGISKDTLYVWEKDGKLPFKLERDIRGWRQYTEKQVTWLKSNLATLLGSARIRG